MRYLLILFLTTHLTTHAGEDAQSMNVLVKVLRACRIVAIENIIFVGYGAIAKGKQTTTGSIKVRCSEGVDYRIGLDMGENETNSKRAMKYSSRNSVSKVTYDLFYDANYSQEWHNSSGHCPSGSGNGEKQEYVVYAKIREENQTARAGIHKDTVGVILEF